MKFSMLALLLLAATAVVPGAAAAAAADLLGCLAGALPGASPRKVVGPEDGELYDAASIMSLGWRASPSAVVYAYDTKDVVAAVGCARDAGVKVTVAGRRHSYQGWSIVDGYLAIDLSNLTSIEVDPLTHTVTAGAGNTNALLLSAVTAKGGPGAASVIGACPSVGIIGYILGGGQGDISPYAGLGADQLLSLEMVLANGTVVTADNVTNPDLYWATKGGGGGLGVITSVTLRYHILPDPDHVTLLILTYKPEVAVDAALRFQDFLATDPKLYGGSAVIARPPTGFAAKLLFLGPWKEALAGLEAGGMLDPTLLGDLTVASTAGGKPLPDGAVPRGVVLGEFTSYLEAQAYIICSGTLAGNIVACRELGLNCTGAPVCEDSATLAAIMQQAGDPTSPLNVGTSELWLNGFFATNGGRLVRALPREAWQAAYDLFSQPAGMCAGAQIGINHLVQGAPAAVDPAATAFPWRNASFVVVVNNGVNIASMAWSMMKASGDLAKAGAMVDDACMQAAELGLGSLESNSPQGALSQFYYNYLAPNNVTGNSWTEVYFGDNYPRLQAIKAAYDPTGLFSKPLTVLAPGATAVDVAPARPLYLDGTIPPESTTSPSTAPAPGTAPAPSQMPAPSPMPPAPRSAATNLPSNLLACAVAIIVALVWLHA